MSLSAALSGALSSLQANQAILTTIAANISNANTEGYSTQQPSLVSVNANGQAIGVALGDVTRQVDEILNTQIQTQSSGAGKASVIKEFMDKILFEFGTPGNDTDLNSFMSTFFDNISAAAATPSDFVTQSLAVDAGVTLASYLSEASNALIDLQFDLDKDIDKLVDSANTSLERLKGINNSISIAISQGQSTNSLLDERDLLVKDLSSILDISVQEDANGLLTVYASNGNSQFALLNSQGSNLRLAYTPASSRDVFVNGGTLGAINIEFLDNNDAVILTQEFVESGAAGGGVSSSLDGKLGGLLQVRDTDIPEFLDLLGNFATNLIDSFNALHNDSVGLPPPSTLTGTLEVDNDTALSTISGSTMFAVLNSDGSPITAPYSHMTANDDGDPLMPPLTINFDDIISADGTGTVTPEVIAKEFNEYYNEMEDKVSLGPLGNIDLRGSSSSGTSAAKVVEFNLEALNLDDGAATIVVSGITVTGGDGGESVDALPSELTGGFSIAAGTRAFEPATFTVNFDGTNVQTVNVTVQVTDADGTVTNSVLTYTFDPTQTNANVQSERYPPATADQDGTIISPSPLTSIASATFVDSSGNAVASGADGYLKIATTSSSTGIGIDEMAGSIGSSNPRGISHYFGLNDFFVESRATTENSDPNQALSISVTQALQDNPALFARGTLQLSQQPSDAASDPLYTYGVSAGDGSAAQGYITMLLSPLDIAAAGQLPGVSTSLSEYSGSILEVVALRTNKAANDDNQQALILGGLVERQQSFSGVNVDTELANSILFQNAFSAAARVIGTVDELFDELLSIGA